MRALRIGLIGFLLALGAWPAAAQAPLAPVGHQQFFDSNGDPLASGTLETYTAGTSTPKATYSDSTLGSANPTTITLNASGRPSVSNVEVGLFLTTGCYKFILKNSSGTTIWTHDNICAQAVAPTVLSKTATYSVATTDGNDVLVLCDATSGAFTTNFYTAVGNAGKRIALKKTDSSTSACTADPNGTETIDGQTTVALSMQYDTLWVESDGSNWHTVSRLLPWEANPTRWGLAASVSGNALTVALTTASGATPTASAPVMLGFRNVTAATGSLSTVTVSAASTIVVPDTATLGTSNNVPFRGWIVAFNDGGTVRLGIINCAASGSIYPLAAWGIASSTTISTGADSAQVFYTDSGVTSKSYLVLGYVTYESGLATAGTYASAPTRAQVYALDVPLPGRVVQSVWSSYSTSTGSSSATLADTGLTATITPSSAANRVLAIVNQNGCRKTTSDTTLRIALFRAASNIGELAAEAASTGNTSAVDIGSVSTALMDSPATTSATTYKTQFASTSGLGTVTVQAASSVSTMLLQEVMQ